MSGESGPEPGVVTDPAVSTEASGPRDEDRPSAASRAAARAKILGGLRGLLVFSGLLPWALPLLRARLPLGDVGVGLDLVFFTMCHRRPARTLSFEGVPMPLCSRCAGIFLGVAIAALVGRPIVPMRTWRWAFAAACGLMILDVVTQDLGLHPVWHPGRITTGVLVGYAMVVGFLSALAADRRA